MYSDVQSAASRLLDSFKSYYNIYLQENSDIPLIAICDYFETSQRYVISKKAELYSANCEEFIFLFSIPHLTKEVYEKCMDYVALHWEERANIKEGHMYTYVTPIFLCETAEDEAVKLLKKVRIYKSFKFSLWGWMEYHTAVFETGNDSIFTNGRGRCVGKTLHNTLIGKKNHRRFFK